MSEPRIIQKQTGNFLEDFRPGQVFRHRGGKTLTEGLFTTFTEFAMTSNPLAKNARYARAYGFEGLLVPQYALREELGGVGAFFTGWLVIPGGFDVEENARELPLPLLFVHGSDDRMTPLEPAAEVFAASREARAPRTVSR